MLIPQLWTLFTLEDFPLELLSQEEVGEGADVLESSGKGLPLELELAPLRGRVSVCVPHTHV